MGTSRAKMPRHREVMQLAMTTPPPGHAQESEVPSDGRIADGSASGNQVTDGSATDNVVPEVRSRWSSPLVRRIYLWARIILVSAILAVGFRTYVAQTYFIPSGSMIPTLQVGDRIVVNRLPLFSHDIHRGDIVVFRRVPGDSDPNHPADLVKRVIGLPGETISSVGDHIYINGHLLREPWLPDFNAQPSSDYCGETSFNIKTTSIKLGHYYVLGDCRGNSLDSRYWGTVPGSYIVGKVVAVVWRNGHPFLHWF